jgi:polyisoprenoid-binding protein YceI
LITRRRYRRLGVWLLGGVALLALVVFGGAWVYIHEIEGAAPKPLSLKSASSPDASRSAGTTGSGGTASVAGTWLVTSGSIVGYRVNEVLAGQSAVAVGRTSDVTGTMTIRGETVTAASFTVQMDTVKSNESERDVQFNGRIMDTSSYPTGTLTLTAPIRLGTLPADGVVTTYHATANLALHGRSRTVAFVLQAERTSAWIEVAGSIPVLFADWGISNPSIPPFVTTQNHGEMEFLIKFSEA